MEGHCPLLVARNDRLVPEIFPSLIGCGVVHLPRRVTVGGPRHSVMSEEGGRASSDAHAPPEATASRPAPAPPSGSVRDAHTLPAGSHADQDDAEGAAEAGEGGETPKKLTKSQRKALKYEERKARMKANRFEERQRKKRRRQERKAELLAEGKDPREALPQRVRKRAKAEFSDRRIVIDLGFDDLMTPMVRASSPLPGFPTMYGVTWNRSARR